MCFFVLWMNWKASYTIFFSWEQQQTASNSSEMFQVKFLLKNNCFENLILMKKIELNLFQKYPWYKYIHLSEWKSSSSSYYKTSNIIVKRYESLVPRDFLRKASELSMR